MIGDGTGAGTVASAVAARGRPVLKARLKADTASVAALTGKRVLAFAGIGDPGRFFRTLRGAASTSRGRKYSPIITRSRAPRSRP